MYGERGGFLKYNIITIILVAFFIYPIIKGFLFKYSSKALKNTINSIFGSIALILSIIITSKNIGKVFNLNNIGKFDKFYSYIPQKILELARENPLITRIIVTIFFILLIQGIIILIFYIFNSIIFYPLLNLMDENLKGKSNITRRICGAVFQLPKSICYIILITFLLTITGMFNRNENYLKALEDSELYTLISEKVVKPITKSDIVRSLPTVVNDSLKIIVENDDVSKKIDNNILEDYLEKKVTVYYNGITLDDGIKSNDTIKNKTLTITNSKSSTYDKAYSIYEWIGKNIDYDDGKANDVINNSKDVKSGAIEAFKTGRGVCFDYACLFVAMCRESNIKVRMVIGEGFNGKEWVNHSWNEFYDDDNNRWINVDSTFYSGGNYFNNSDFSNDHRNTQVVGEW